ncbi:MAG: PilT/PilU family type 4a pilus ATPase, partial [Victivallaceae bacterium]|nr:PilT/PilU family type 4a pilus ATPase [Victivallaceae bacterium]
NFDMSFIAEMLEYAVEIGASDLFASAGKVPRFRCHGEVVAVSDERFSQPLPPEEIDDFRARCLSDAEKEIFRTQGAADVSCMLDNEQRFRLNFFSTMWGCSFVARPIRSGGVLEFETLGLPTTLAKFCGEHRGIILVTGATGSGKSTTLATMVNYINHTRACHILTIEDPIEYIHADAKSLISQRELRSDVTSFAEAIRSAMRENPDVIVIGEMRDLETVQAAISAALTGHLVITTLHTSDAVGAVERVVNLFPEDQRSQAAGDLGAALLGVVSQRLLPRKDSSGMIVAVEFLVGTPTVRKRVALCDYPALDDALRRGGAGGMTTFLNAVYRLLVEDKVTLEAALQAVDNREELMLLAQGMTSGSNVYVESNEDVEEDEKAVDMRRLLRSAVSERASDLLLTAGSPPVLRINGSLNAMNLPVLTGHDLQRLLYSVITPRQRIAFEDQLELDFALSTTMANSAGMEENYRFRINGFFQRGVIGVVARVVPSRIPPPEQLGIPKAVVDLVHQQQGLVLVTGPTGSGKSTTLASLIDLINRTRATHIITIEDPIEYIHEHDHSLIEQRELHADTSSFATALKYALREDPDVILLGEMRDVETMAAAITAAETGHLVFSTVHTNSAPQTIDRIIDSFPPGQQNQIRQQLAGVILSVISQRLVPRIDGRGRVAAFEVMMGTSPVRALIREAKTFQLQSSIETGGKDGMMTLQKSLEEYYAAGLISLDEIKSMVFEEKKVAAFR